MSGQASLELFNGDPWKNLLPGDGIVNYFGRILSAADALNYFEALLNNIAWKNDEAIIFGRHFITPRKVAWYGEKEFPYTYSNTTKLALSWTKELTELKMIAEERSGSKFNSCLLNLYHNGSEGMAWHSDDEKALAVDGTIATITLGAERKFSFRHKATKEIVSLVLESGSLLLMRGSTQKHWLHRLPPTTRISTPRISLTFRSMVGS